MAQMSFDLKRERLGAGMISQMLRTLDAFAQGLGSLPKAQIVTPKPFVTPVPGNMPSSSGLFRH